MIASENFAAVDGEWGGRRSELQGRRCEKMRGDCCTVLGLTRKDSRQGRLKWRGASFVRLVVREVPGLRVL